MDRRSFALIDLIRVTPCRQRDSYWKGMMVSTTPGPLASPEGLGEKRAAQDSWVPRFGRTERFAHWWTVAMMGAGLLSGLAMGDDAGSGSLLGVHVGSVALLGTGLGCAIIFGDSRALLRSARRLFSFDGRDAAWLKARVTGPFDGAQEPEWGMFNTGQKVLAWALSASIAALIITGVLSWSAGGEGGLHGIAIFATFALLSAHLFMAVLNSATRPALAGMLFGRVRRSWAAKHHSEWLKDLDREGTPASAVDK
jgi:formate dehydrogenase subunit gamma